MFKTQDPWWRMTVMNETLWLTLSWWFLNWEVYVSRTLWSDTFYLFNLCIILIITKKAFILSSSCFPPKALFFSFVHRKPLLLLLPRKCPTQARYMFLGITGRRMWQYPKKLFVISFLLFHGRKRRECNSLETGLAYSCLLCMKDLSNRFHTLPPPAFCRPTQHFTTLIPNLKYFRRSLLSPSSFRRVLFRLQRAPKPPPKNTFVRGPRLGKKSIRHLFASTWGGIFLLFFYRPHFWRST